MSQNSIIDKLDHDFILLHQKKEEAFWLNYMGIENKEQEYLKAEKALNEFKNQSKTLTELRSLLKSNLNEEEKKIVSGWIRFFEKNCIENPKAAEHYNEIIELESKIGTKKREYEPFYIDPKNQNKISASSNFLSMMITTEKEEGKRKAAYDALLASEDFILENSYIELIHLRNAFARELGYQNFMDYKCQFAEDMDIDETFSLIDQAVQGVKETWFKTLSDFQSELGKEALEPWNFTYLTSGDLKHELDPYYPFESSVKNWLESFAALNIDYHQATLTLDLLDRKGKYENGFMHGPGLSYLKNGTWHPARINFTANANPNQIGSGQRAINTLFHEGGHAAHFSNIEQASPVFSQEYPPTSMALAETQSMLLDSLITDGAWQLRYAKDRQGKTLPFELIEKIVRKTQKLKPSQITSMAVVSLFEKEIFSLKDSELTAKRIKEIARETERQVLGKKSPRPVLTIPHLLHFDSSCTYHGYLFAMFGVMQSRSYFIEKHGTLVDNPNIGPSLKEKYWKPGNTKSFKTLVHDLTERELSAQDLIQDSVLSADEYLSKLKKRILATDSYPRSTKIPELNCSITIIHGKEEIANNTKGNEKLAQDFSSWIQKGQF